MLIIEKYQDRSLRATRSVGQFHQFVAEEAKSLGHKHVGSEHLLLGLVKLADTMKDKIVRSPFAEVFENYGVTLEKVRFIIQETVLAEEKNPNKLIYNEKALKTSRKAIDFAAANKDKKLNPIHYLIAIVQEENDRGAQILSQGFGLDKSKLGELEEKANEHDPLEDVDLGN